MPPNLNGPLSPRGAICAACRLRAPRSRCDTRSLMAAKRRYASSAPSHLQLPRRTLIRLAGPDAAHFLDNIIPARILNTGSSRPIYTAFLSSHGRILNDVFIYPPPGGSGEEWFVEVDSQSAGELLKHLKKHKLRSKFQLNKVEDGENGVFYLWPSAADDARVDARIGGPDPRPGMGTRWIDAPLGSQTVQKLKDAGSTQATPDQYTVHRMENGVAEGQSELIATSALPQESNIDFIGGIDFHKGCYLGQELTIRTHHTGVVRKRILPVQLYSDEHSVAPGLAAPEYIERSTLSLPPLGSNISRLNAKGRGRSSGKWLDGIGNIGLALCRLEMMTDIQLTTEKTNYDPTEEYKVVWEVEGEGVKVKEVKLKPFVPDWVRAGVEANLRRKERPKKRQDEDEDNEELD